jgi:hypothetical protein
MARSDQQVGAIEARCPHPDQDFVGGRRRLLQIAKLDPRLT